MPTEPFRNDYPVNDYRVDPIYTRMTLPRGTADDRSSLPSVQDLFGQLSTTSHFKVSMFLGDAGSKENADKDLNSWLISCGVLGDTSNYQSLKYEFMCHSTTLPGATMRTFDEYGSRQGITERFPVTRDYEPITMEFYVDAKEYGIIRLFEEWLNFINPLYTSRGRATSGSRAGSTSSKENFSSNNFYRLRYPNTYTRDIAVTKFERDLIVENGTVRSTPSMLTYKFINAYPISLTALPVSYEVSTITKTSVTFNYERYVILNHGGKGGEAEYQFDPPNKARTQNGETIVTSSPNVVNGSTNQSPSTNLPRT